MAKSRFTDVEINKNKLAPIYGYWNSPLISLNKAIEPIYHLIPNLARYVKEAQKRCHYPNEFDLTKDESAAIFLYTMEWGSESFYKVLNSTLRSEDRSELKPFFSYLRLFESGYLKLPLYTRSVWRGVNFDVSCDFKTNESITWWGVSSCSQNVDVVEKFLKSNGTLFLIEPLNGRDLNGYTAFTNEAEILLPPGSDFTVVAISSKCAENIHIVHLRELDDKVLSGSHNVASSFTSILPNVNDEFHHFEDVVSPSNPSSVMPIENTSFEVRNRKSTTDNVYHLSRPGTSVLSSKILAKQNRPSSATNKSSASSKKSPSLTSSPKLIQRMNHLIDLQDRASVMSDVEVTGL